MMMLCMLHGPEAEGAGKIPYRGKDQEKGMPFSLHILEEFHSLYTTI